MLAKIHVVTDATLCLGSYRRHYTSSLTSGIDVEATSL